jgi:hypothetical protein
VEQAAAESGLNPNAKASTSSATGLFQFIESTWLQSVKRHGTEFGLAKEASQIQIDQHGKAFVNDPVAKKAILDLRHNPDIASGLAAKLAQSNETYLKHHVKDIDVGKTELYFAHFMGANGASRFLNALKNNPNADASLAFKKEARANHNVFFNPETGQSRSLKQVYAFFDQKFNTSTPTPNNFDQTNPTHPVTDYASLNKTDAQKSLETFYHYPTFASAPKTNISHALGYTPRLGSDALFFIQQIASDIQTSLFKKA